MSKVITLGQLFTVWRKRAEIAGSRDDAYSQGLARGLEIAAGELEQWHKTQGEP